MEDAHPPAVFSVNTQEFIAKIVPVGGRYITARLVEVDGRRRWRHYVHQSAGEAARRVLDLSASGVDAYFALASYKRGFYTDDTGKKVVRKRENVEALKALWFDIDLKDGYSDVKEALADLRGFTKILGMPSPSAVVHSGHGLHVYWCLDTAVPPDRWQGLSEALKGAAGHLGLKADLRCTADAARVLRPAGTKNYKGDPVDVKILGASWAEYPFQTLEEPLLPYKPTVRVKAKGVNSELTGGMGAATDPKRFELILKHCGVAQYALASQGVDASEPEWMATLQLLRHCEDGDLYVHRVSSGHPSYTEAGTEQKYAQRSREVGPTKCSTFRDFHKETCAKCPFSGSISSPIQLGVEGVTDPNAMPKGYRRVAEGFGVERLVVMNAEEGQREWVKVFPYTPVRLKFYWDFAQGRAGTSVILSVPDGKKAIEREVDLSGGVFSDGKEFNRALTLVGIFMQANELKEFRTFMTSWLQQVQANRGANQSSSQLGWVADGTGFALPPSIYRSDGSAAGEFRAASNSSEVVKHYEAKGSIDVWKQSAQFLIDQNDPKLIAALAASFGCPLLKFAGVSGGIVSLASTASGAGKSFSLKVAQAVWGSPAHGINSTSDTPNAVMNKLSFLQNLPVLWDEIRGAKTLEDFATFAFQLTQGTEKARLGSDAQARPQRSWKTVLVCASNESMFNVLHHSSVGSDAGMYRCYEIELEALPQERDVKTASKLTPMLDDHYGAAGHVLAQFYAQNVSRVQADLVRTFEYFQHDRPPAERYWSTLMALMLLGLKYAVHLGLVKVDTKAFARFLLHNRDLLNQRLGNDTQDSIEDAVAAYIQSNSNCRMKVENVPPSDINGKTAKQYQPLITMPPSANRLLMVEYEDAKELWVALDPLKQFLMRRGFPHYGLKRQLEERLRGDFRRVILGLNTIYSSNRSWVVVFDLAKWADSYGLSDILDSLPETEPEDSTES